ncbi:MAG: 6-phosphogluconolactonase [Candidatus Eisenbacteria bacterium]|uniref:6-phosphogluconolactonase n=1 Tax=Eiseniibacteriota bacterium TaxID=2212470 RepID=A0A538T8X9_UNCEI|nr:MAG: 6-phosphogluconolactonase [Candidatus Eisenbacteria bacterium]
MKDSNAHVRILADRDEVARVAAEELIAAVAGATPERPRRILLSGGTTPEPLYRILASEPTRSRIDWNSIECYFGDERPVPQDHPESNSGLAFRTLLEPLGLQAPRTYRIRGEASDLELAARRYEALIRARFAAPPPADPSFDLVYLGLGEDGHTASLFPGVRIPDDPPRLVVAVWIEALQGMRATVTYRLLNAARRIVFLVAGKEKAIAVQRTLAPGEGEEPTPAARVSPANGEVIWLLDRGAAGRLPRTTAQALEEERR